MTTSIWAMLTTLRTTSLSSQPALRPLRRWVSSGHGPDECPDPGRSDIRSSNRSLPPRKIRRFFHSRTSRARKFEIRTARTHIWARRDGSQIACWNDLSGSCITVIREAPLDAGQFSVWLDTFREILRIGETSNVPCDGCTACCTSSQFIHIAPDEVDTLAEIPRELLFPAPRLPVGHLLMGYDENGHCPMLLDGACSIYAHRPRTCRTYDCRAFAASGLEIDDPKKSAINDRVRLWQFQFVDEFDRAKLDAVRSAADFVAKLEPRSDATERTLAAVEMHDQFMPD